MTDFEISVGGSVFSKEKGVDFIKITFSETIPKESAVEIAKEITKLLGAYKESK